MDITELLAFSAKQGASDLHLSAGLPPMIRVDGDVRRINLPPLGPCTGACLIYDIMNDKQRKDFEEFLETDFSFEVPGVARFGLTPSTRTGVLGGIPNHSVESADDGRSRHGQIFRRHFRCAARAGAW